MPYRPAHQRGLVCLRRPGRAPAAALSLARAGQRLLDRTGEPHRDEGPMPAVRSERSRRVAVGAGELRPDDERMEKTE